MKEGISVLRATLAYVPNMKVWFSIEVQIYVQNVLVHCVPLQLIILFEDVQKSYKYKSCKVEEGKSKMHFLIPVCFKWKNLYLIVHMSF